MRRSFAMTPSTMVGKGTGAGRQSSDTVSFTINVTLPSLASSQETKSVAADMRSMRPFQLPRAPRFAKTPSRSRCHIAAAGLSAIRLATRLAPSPPANVLGRPYMRSPLQGMSALRVAVAWPVIVEMQQMLSPVAVRFLRQQQLLPAVHDVRASYFPRIKLWAANACVRTRRSPSA